MDTFKKPYGGIYRGVVKDVRDPKKSRRVKLQVPQVTGSAVTDWAWPLEPANVSTEPPAVGQGVWVFFIGSDPDYPVWTSEFGKHQAASKKVYINSLLNTVSLTGLSTYLILKSQPDGTKEVDLIATLVAMANKIKDHETRITALESNLTALHNTLGTKTSPSHTHTSAG